MEIGPQPLLDHQGAPAPAQPLIGGGRKQGEESRRFLEVQDASQTKEILRRGERLQIQQPPQPKHLRDGPTQWECALGTSKSGGQHTNPLTEAACGGR